MGTARFFPMPLGEAALFDPETWALTAREAAKEAAADGLAMTFAPMLDVARDPRWGRIAEGPGEDPWLGARIAEAKVRGFQGANARRRRCARGRRQALTAPMARSPPDATTPRSISPSARCAKCICRRSRRRSPAGVAAIMPAFTDLAGIPMTANRELLRDWLRGRSASTA